MPSIEELKAKVAEALASGDDKAFMLAIAEVAKEKSAVAKAQAEAAKVEAEQLAGAREKLAKTIHKSVASPELIAELQAVKATGFTYKLDDGETTYRSVALLVPTVRTRTGGGGGGGKSRDEFGISLTEIFEKFATDADRVAMTEALEKDKTVSNQGYSYNVKKAVKKAAIANGLLQPVK